MQRANCLTFEETQDKYDSDCQLIREEINGVPVVCLASEVEDVEEKRGRLIRDDREKESKRPRIRELAPAITRRSPCNAKLALTVATSRTMTPNKDKLWATLRE